MMMLTAWLLRSAALCLCIGAVSAVEDAAYIKVADLSATGLTDNVVSMRAVIKVALNDNSVPDFDHNDHVTWTHGKTKVDLTVEWAAGFADDKIKQVQFGISGKECSDPDVATGLNIYPGGAGQKFQWSLNLETTKEETGTKGGKKLSYALVKDLVISLPLAPCAYLVYDSVPQATVTVVPSPPVFPNSFYAGIESTHITNGYSRYGSEAYSQSCDAVSFAFYNSDVGFKRIIGDYKNQKVWHITSPNATFANGVCWNEPMADRPEFVEGEGGGLVTTAKFLGFVNTNGNEATYMPEGAKAIRGVPTDQWRYKTKREGAGNTEERLTVHLYFSSIEWHFAKSAGHRILQRAEVTGHTDDTTTNTSAPVGNTYDYIDFRPFLPPWAGFEPCEIMPGGEGCECLNLGCTDTTAAAEKGVITAFASPASCEAIGVGGRSNAHRRNLTLTWFFGVLVGAILAIIAAFFARKHIEAFLARRQDIKETEIVDQPPARVFGSFAAPTVASDQYQMEQQ